MINRQLINPSGILIAGGSNNISKPGGRVLKNIREGTFRGELVVLNPNEDEVQGVKSYRKPGQLPHADLAIMAIPARLCPDLIDFLAREKGTLAFIILSAGFGEESRKGKRLEENILGIVQKYGAALIGPNCIGVLNAHYQGVFTPVPELDPMGCDLVSGSGATAVFIMESGIPRGIRFSSVFSVGNSTQNGVEEVLEYLDESYIAGKSSRVKLLYFEQIRNPELLLKHARSLAEKGCRIAAIKAGSSHAGSRAASSHTGALATPDAAVDALFRKAGIIRCISREELIGLAGVLLHKPLPGENIAIITHAGGPGVMLTDVLSAGGLKVPEIKNPAAGELLDRLNPGSSVANPIDFLATGTAAQLGLTIDFCEQRFDEIDAMVVIFGSPGLFSVQDVYDVLDEKMNSCRKPIYPVLPSVVNAKDETEAFVAGGRINFPDEVVLGRALVQIARYVQPVRMPMEWNLKLNEKGIREIVERTAGGYLSLPEVGRILDHAGIDHIPGRIAANEKEALSVTEETGFPLVMKVLGPLHKSGLGGVDTGIGSPEQAKDAFRRLMKIPGAEGVLIQPRISGIELFAGVKHEEGFGHLIMCGLGGVMVEALRDIQTGLAPLDVEESFRMIRGLKAYEFIRGQEGVDEKCFAGVLGRLSDLVRIAPEIVEMDLNPLMGGKNELVSVDARIRIKK